MSIYASGAIVSLILFGMAMTAIILGIETYRKRGDSNAGPGMFYMFVSVFVWDACYAWMGLCHNDDFAYVPRALALIGVYLYMLASIEYVGELAHYPKGRRYVFYVIYLAAAVVSWFKITGRDSVSFTETPWGYWYVSRMTWGRYIQFGCILCAILFFFIVLSYWRRTTMLKREHQIIRRFVLFAPIIFAGYVFDTLLPSLYDVPALPGSAVAAFISAVILYAISLKYMAFGISEANISRYVFRDVEVPVLVLDRNGRTVLWNSKAAGYFAAADGSLYGRKRDELVSLPDDDDLIGEIRGEEIYEVIGSDSYCRLTETDYYDDFGDLLYTICFVQDVTDIRNAIRMMDESRRSAEAANRSKNVFMANMSHELRSPMSVIMGMSDIMLRSPDVTGDVRHNIVNIKDAGESLIGIVNDLLDISKIEAGQSSLVESDYSLPDLIGVIGNMVRVRLAEKPLEFILDADPELPVKAVGDEMRIRQIFMNLLDNAIENTEKGYIHLKIWGVREYGGIRIFADIADTGMGMHEGEIVHIFDEFVQADMHRRSSGQGSGLGLSVSRHLARAMNGDITVESRYGHGTTFHIEFFQRIHRYEPIGDETAASLKNDGYVSEKKKDDIEYKDHSGKRVLVVDDSRVNLMVAKGLLAPYNMEVDLASGGPQAIDMAKECLYDCIFMDHMMPGMDGVETTRAIRALGGENLNVPVIALTANAVEGTRESLIEAGLQDFIGKPIDRNKLDSIVEKYC